MKDKKCKTHSNVISTTALTTYSLFCLSFNEKNAKQEIVKQTELTDKSERREKRMSHWHQQEIDSMQNRKVDQKRANKKPILLKQPPMHFSRP